MDRTLNVEVRDNTWPPAGGLPAFPPSFHRGTATWTMNFPSMLLKIGYLTTPISSTGVSLSEFWAWVRYLAAITDQNDMRLTQSFADLDAHQKTILSDDFGMGVPMLWLGEKFFLDRILDGRYFMQRVGASVGATQNRVKKRGPNKTPDFVARDTNSVWHIIECKGTQSNGDYAEKQIGSYGPPATGGIAQKRSIIFPPNYTGQRLVSALQIGLEMGEPTRMIISDPTSEEPFKLKESDMELADDSATRAVAAKALRLAGFEATAGVIASPTGSRPDVTYYKTSSAESLRKEQVRDRDARAKDELNTMRQRTVLFDGHYIGREMSIELPKPILVSGKAIVRVNIQQGVKMTALEEMLERTTIERTIASSKVEWEGQIGVNKSFGQETNAQLDIGTFFRSEISLAEA